SQISGRTVSVSEGSMSSPAGRPRRFPLTRQSRGATRPSASLQLLRGSVAATTVNDLSRHRAIATTEQTQAGFAHLDGEGLSLAVFLDGHVVSVVARKDVTKWQCDLAPFAQGQHSQGCRQQVVLVVRFHSLVLLGCSWLVVNRPTRATGSPT